MLLGQPKVLGHPIPVKEENEESSEVCCEWISQISQLCVGTERMALTAGEPH